MKDEDKRVVVLGILGKVEDDRGYAKDRWEQWRPTVDLCRHKNLAISRYELFYQPKDRKLADLTAKDIQQVSPKTKVNLLEVIFKNHFNLEEVFNVFYDFAENYEFKFEEERYLVNISTGTHIMKICLFLLTEAKYFPANLVQSPKPSADKAAGKENYVEPYIEIDLRLEKHKKIAQRLTKEKQNDLLSLKDYIQTKNIIFEDLMKQILHVSLNSSSPILLTGKTGVGKSSLAARIHEKRKEKLTKRGQFISVNCATLQGDTVRSELFGHERGAFTGANESKEGFLKQADKGTLFLDEIGELDLEVQAMLLKAIEEKTYFSVGNKKVESEFYLITGTNSDLSTKVKEGLFRRDLLARIDTFHFEMPELKERPEDFEPNLNRELEKFEQENSVKIRITNEAKKKYLNFAKSSSSVWSGNFRDLNSSVIRMATFSENGVIIESVVDDEIIKLKKKWAESSQKHFPFLERLIGISGIQEIDIFYQSQLEEVIRICFESSSRSEAGRKLYNVSRKKKKTINDADRLNKYLETFGLTWEIIKSKLSTTS